MAARFPDVLACRVPTGATKLLKQKAHANDFSLAEYLRRQLMALAATEEKREQEASSNAGR